MLRSSKFRQVAAGTAFALAAIAASRASAEVTDAAPTGFTLRETAHIVAASDKVYAALIEPQHWWSSQHSFSGNAANMSLDARAGGCWCERLADGGSVLHMTVVYAAPGKALRLRGALGPFQAMAVESAMTWTLTSANGGTDIALVSTTGGYTPGGFDKISHAADAVMAEQIARLKSYIESGSPESPKETKP